MLDSLSLPSLAAIAVALLAVGFTVWQPLRRLAFTTWVLASFLVPMVFPTYFISWGSYDLKGMIVPIVQVIMFGMGATLTLQDFTRVLVRPAPILIGVALQYSVMPLAAFAITKLFALETEVAAGLILLGACSGGMASNLITYLAKGDVALSVTMTCCSTLVSPVMTPVAMKLLAGQLVPVPLFGMMISILSMIIVPVIAGLVVHQILHGRARWLSSSIVLLGIALLWAGAAALVIFAQFTLEASSGILTGVAVCAVLLAMVTLGQLCSPWLRWPKNWMDLALPVVSMIAICLSIALITARSSETLMQIGLLLAAAAALHNGVGYLAGYWIPRWCGLSIAECRTVSIEVGMQNGGMATGLAIDVLHSTKAALAPTIFGAWQNLSGSMLAMLWGQTAGPPEESTEALAYKTESP